MFHIQSQLNLGRMRLVIVMSVLMLMIGGMLDLCSHTKLISQNAEARPLSLMISEVNAPYPNHCLDQRQWINPHLFSPYNLFDRERSQVWQLCDYAIKDQGYTVNFKLAQPIEIDGFILKQVLKKTSETQKKHI